MVNILSLSAYFVLSNNGVLEGAPFVEIKHLLGRITLKYLQYPPDNRYYLLNLYQSIVKLRNAFKALENFCSSRRIKFNRVINFDKIFD